MPATTTRQLTALSTMDALQIHGQLNRRRFSSIAALALASTVLPLRAAPGQGHLPLAGALDDQLSAALRQGSPLIVMVSLDGCTFCRMVRESHLLAMAAQGLPVVQVDWRSNRALRDFAGAATTHDGMVRRWGIRVAPTVLFFGPQGREVAERMVGSYQPDFYGSYLESRLEQGRRALRG